MNHRPSAAAPLLVLLALVTGPPAIYTSSYYLACDYAADPSLAVVIRRYRYEWQRCLFEPAAQMESSATGREVVIPENFR
jgi:hypothetical protein